MVFVCYFVYIYIDIVGVLCVLARANFMAYISALMIFWRLGSTSVDSMLFPSYRL